VYSSRYNTENQKINKKESDYTPPDSTRVDADNLSDSTPLIAWWISELRISDKLMLTSFPSAVNAFQNRGLGCLRKQGKNQMGSMNY